LEQKANRLNPTNFSPLKTLIGRNLEVRPAGVKRQLALPGFPLRSLPQADLGVEVHIQAHA